MPVAEKHQTASIPAAGVRWQPFLAPALLLLIIVGFYWKLLLTNQYTWLDGPDNAHQVLPWLQFQAGEWHAGRFPAWDPYLWGGQSLIGQAQPGAAYPLNWLLFLLPLRDGWIQQSFLHWYYALIHFQAALFCYWLCRDLNRSRPASLLAGISFALGGYVGTTDWPQMLNGAVWAPLVFLFFLRAMRGWRPVSSAAWAGLFLGVAFLSGHHQVPIFISLALGVAFVYFFLTGSRTATLKAAAIMGVFLILSSALQTFPAYEYGKLSLRWVSAKSPVSWDQPVPYYVHEMYSLNPASVLGIILPGIHRNTNPFAGVTAVSLAFLAIASAWHERAVRLFAAIGLAGILLALGGYSVLQGVLYAILPIVEKARSPGTAILVFHLALAVLAAYGIDHFSASRWTRNVVRALLGGGAFLALLVLVLSIVKYQYDERLALSMIIFFLIASTLAAWSAGRLSPAAAPALLVVAMLIELSSVAAFLFQHRDQAEPRLKNLAGHSDIALFLQQQNEPVRAEIDDKQIPYNFGDWYGIDHFGGYLASLSLNVNRVQGIGTARRMYAVNYTVAPERRSPDQIEVFTSKTGMKVFRNPAALPRAWIVHRATSIARADDAESALGAPSFDPRREVFLQGGVPELATCDGAEDARLIERTSNRVVIEANLKCRGMVIAAETFAPGWTATIDGRPAQVVEAYTFLRGVVAEAGKHRIELRYRPESVYWGGALTAMAFAGAAALSIRRL
ncbi:MAG: hypothetical protein ACRD8O_11125 [Bryobacteraceae bacterium]